MKTCDCDGCVHGLDWCASELEAVARALTPLPGKPYEPMRDYRFEYAGDAVEWLEEHCCSQGKGCANAGTRKTVARVGAGGVCPFIAGIFAEETQPEIRDLGRKGLTCSAYVERVPVRRHAHLDAPSHGVPSLFEESR